MVEGSAIMQYICDKHGLDAWWPQGSGPEAVRTRARVSEYMSNHHTTTRLLTLNTFKPTMTSVMDPTFKFDADAAFRSAQDAAATFDETWLTRGKYVAGGDAPTIADLLAYTELAQVEQLGYPAYSGLPRLQHWLDNLRALPHHDDVHASLFKLAAIRQKMLAKKA